jgi:2,4-dienoyl-CoA reductase-like NADH-dependent reductase (Old Yellow Enzyme family)
VELHGAHGYLLSQFTSPYFNRREDEYGGSPERRWRLSLELIREIRDEVGNDFAMGYRFSAREGIPGGLEFPESLEMAKALGRAGVDYLSVSRGCYGAATHVAPNEEGAMTADAAMIRHAVSVPVMCPNFQDPDRAAAAVSDGSTDLVALSRALLADPRWTEKVRQGQAKEIRRCIRCYHCFRDAIVTYDRVRCAVNPMLGFERFDPACFPRPTAPTGTAP